MNESLDKSKQEGSAKEGSVFEKFSPEDIQNIQKVVTEDIIRYIRDEGPLRGVDLSEEEKTLLQKMHAEVRKAREENETRFARGEQNLIEVQFRFSSPDSYRIFSELVNRISEGMLSVIEASRISRLQEKEDRIARRQADDAARLRELEKKAGISESPAEDPQAKKAEMAKKFFGALPEAMKMARQEKIAEYDGRIRTAMSGTPLRPGDTVEQLKKDFQLFARVPWMESFSVQEKEEKK